MIIDYDIALKIEKAAGVTIERLIPHKKRN